MSPQSALWIAVAALLGIVLVAVVVAILGRARWRQRSGLRFAVPMLVAAAAVLAACGAGLSLGSPSRAVPVPRSSHVVGSAGVERIAGAAGGRVESVRIAGRVSHFRARKAQLYLPPAALGPHPPALPIIIALSGEPGTPLDPLDQGHLVATMDALAAAHHGVAPIVLAPDQLGRTRANPMCVDSRLGDVATYLTRDVRTWALTHLPVRHDRAGWTIAGFSEGGTCAIQLAAKHPALFGSLIDVSGELAPANGDLAHTIAAGFGGSRSRYLAATPLHLLAAGAPYDTRAIFAVGALDRRYGPTEPTVVAAARAAGMRTSFWRIPGDRHNWSTGTAGLTWGVHELTPLWHLPS